MMRIANSTLYDQGVNNITTMYAQLGHTQNQLSTGRRVLTPSDDPIAAARSLDLTQSQDINTQYGTNINAASASLGATDNALSSVTTILQSVHTLVVQAGDGVLAPSDLSAIANQIQANYQELLGQANATDGNGQYLFAGYKGSTPAFTETSPGNVVYNGDQGQRLEQISAGRQIPSSVSGSSVFQLDPNGNGTFVTAAAPANTGTGVVSPGTVTNSVAWSNAANPQNFTVKFYVDNTQTPPVTTYDVIDNVNNVSLETGAAPAATGPYLRTYTAGGAINLASQTPPDTNPTPFDYGAQLSVSGDPATGDTFTVNPSTTTDLFSTLNNVVTALNAASTGPVADAKLSNSLNTALSNLDQGLTNVLKVRASVGSYMKELDTAQTTQTSLSTQYQESISQLTDVDYAKAVSDFTAEQQALQAAQASYAKISGLSLFNYLPSS